VLAQRQYGYPIRGAPNPGALVSIWTHYEEEVSPDLIRQIKCAWGEVMRVKEDPRSWIIENKMSYNQWIMEIVKVIKLPFKSDFPPLEQPQPAESKEVTTLKGEMEVIKMKNDKLSNDLHSLQQECAGLRRDNEEKTRMYQELFRKLREERNHCFRVKQDLVATNIELTLRARERYATTLSEYYTNQMYEELKRDKKEALKRLHDAQIKINKMKQQMKEITMTYDVKMNEKHRYQAESEKKYQEMIAQMNDYTLKQEWNIGHWKKCFSQLATLTNGAIEDIPRLLSEVESALPIFNPPKNIETFLDHCKKLIGEMKSMISRPEIRFSF